MAQIVSIRQVGRRRDRCEVDLDSGDTLTFRLEVVLRLGLKPGQEVEAASLQEAAALEESVRAREYALNLLSYAGRSRRQVADRLRRSGFAPQVVEETVERLGRVGLLDDETFARTYVSGRLAERPMGRRALRQELAVKGVDRETAQDAVEEVLADQSELDLALQAARARWPRLAQLPAEDARRRLAGYLGRRGFSPGVCWAAVRQVVQATGGGDEELTDPLATDDGGDADL